MIYIEIILNDYLLYDKMETEKIDAKNSIYFDELQFGLIPLFFTFKKYCLFSLS